MISCPHLKDTTQAWLFYSHRHLMTSRPYLGIPRFMSQNTSLEKLALSLSVGKYGSIAASCLPVGFTLHTPRICFS
jgi:hypothetical protein